jgi:hypothetical protein
MEVNKTCADRVHSMLIRMKSNYAHSAVQICADVHFFVLQSAVHFLLFG